MCFYAKGQGIHEWRVNGICYGKQNSSTIQLREQNSYLSQNTPRLQWLRCILIGYGKTTGCARGSKKVLSIRRKR